MGKRRKGTSEPPRREGAGSSRRPSKHPDKAASEASRRPSPEASGKPSGRPSGRPSRKPSAKPSAKASGRTVRKPAEAELCLPCDIAFECGGCPWLAVPYHEQLERKAAELESLFAPELRDGARFGGVVGMDEPSRYRDKIASPFAPGAPTGKGRTPRILTGMYAAGTHRLVACPDCPVEDPRGRQVVAAVASIARRHGMAPYDEDAHEGFLRHVVVRVGHETGEVLVTVVTNGEDFPGARNFCRQLVAACPFVTSVVQDVNTRRTNAILGGRTRTLYGPGFILDTLCGLAFRISPTSFYQVNARQTEVLYRLAIEAAGLTGRESVVDAYCGTGTIGLVAAAGLPGSPGAKAGSVTGIESVPAAVDDARGNARHNGIENASFVCGDAGEHLRELAREGREVDVVFMDPPRAGSDETFLTSLCRLAPERVVYVSCNPKTQRRDVDFLERHGYRVVSLTGVDMFPHTPHVETVCLLVR